MKSYWEIKRIGEVCVIYSGKNQKAVENPSGKYPIYGSGGIMGYANDYLCRAGSTIIGRKGSINNPIFTDSDFWNVDTAFGISPGDSILPKYLYYFCKGYDFQSLNKGTTIPSLVKTDLLQIPIPVPPLEEQRQIVELLDEGFARIDSLKNKAEDSYNKSKDLFRSALKTELNSGSVKQLQELCTTIVDCPHSTPVKSLSKTNYPCIRTSELGHGRIIWSTMQFVSQEEYTKRISRLAPQYEDIVYGREGTIGNAVMIPKEYNFCLGQRTTLFRPNKELILPKYLLYCVLSPYVFEQAMAKNTGCGVAHVNVAEIKQFKIPMKQNIAEQRAVVSKLDALSACCAQLQTNYLQTVTLCEALKQSLLRNIFKGEI